MILSLLSLFFSLFPQPQIENVKNYAVCYSKISFDETKDFELLILDPDHYTIDEVMELKRSGAILIAYLNIAEFETYRNFSIPDSLIIGRNPIWEDHFYVNISSEVWQNLIFNEIIPKIISKGFDGFFLDMIDIVQIFPHFKNDVIKIVKLIRAQNEGKIIITNNGWALLDTLKNYADGFLIEGLFTRYDFQKKKYFVRFEKEYKEKVKVLKSTGKKIFTLDFLPEKDNRRKFVRNLSLHYGFTPYVSTIELNKIYK
ncbi:MAG: endo alpha-1,4 polygalactosaminidase [Candidatus Kryptonium sp.]